MKHLLLTGLFAALLSANLLRSQNSLTPLDSAMIGCYPFSGNANDYSGNGINGLVNGALLTTDRFGSSNSAYSFSGNTPTSNIVVPNFTGLLTGNEVSISFWTTCNAYATRAVFLIVPDNVSNRFTVCVYYGNNISNSQIYWDYGDIFSAGRMMVNGCPLPPPSTWDHWVFVISQTGSYMRCYRNGLQFFNKPSTSVFSPLPLRSLSIGGGYDVNNGNLWYNGKIDDIRIYNRVLLPSEVSFLYNNNVTCVACPALSTPSAVSGNNSFCQGSTVTFSATSTSTVQWFSSPGSTTSIGSGTSFSTPNYSVAGTYTLYARAVSDCTFSAALPVVVTVNQLPLIQISASPSLICQGQTSSLFASGAVNYTWQPGNLQTPSVSVSPAATTMYTLVGIDNNDCADTSQFQIFVNGLPTLQVSSTNSNICAGSKTQLSATGALSYTWHPGNIQNSTATVSPASNTTYTLMGINSSACSNTTAYQVFVSTCAGMKGINSQQPTCRIYPNPATAGINIEWSVRDVQEAIIEVLDIQGRVLHSSAYFFSPHKPVYKLDLSTLPPNLYYVKVTGNTGAAGYFMLSLE